MVLHMRKHADILRPKFETVLSGLKNELGGLEIGSWLEPREDTSFPLIHCLAVQKQS